MFKGPCKMFWPTNICPWAWNQSKTNKVTSGQQINILHGTQNYFADMELSRRLGIIKSTGKVFIEGLRNKSQRLLKTALLSLQTCLGQFPNWAFRLFYSLSAAPRMSFQKQTHAHCSSAAPSHPQEGLRPRPVADKAISSKVCLCLRPIQGLY